MKFTVNFKVIFSLKLILQEESSEICKTVIIFDGINYKEQ